MGSSSTRRVRIERGIYRQRNGKYAVCWRHAGRLRFRTVGFDLAAARRERLALIAATREGELPVSPRLCFETVAGWWLERFEAKVAAGVRHPRTLEAHRYQLDRHLLPALGRRRVAALTVDDVAELLQQLRTTGRSAKTAAGALATLQSVMRFARRCGWIVADPVERLEHDERPRPQRRRQRVLGRAEIERLLQTGTVAVRTRQRNGVGRGQARLAMTLIDRSWTDPLPIYAWLIEHPEGLIVVDTGETAAVNNPGYFPRWHPYFRLGLKETVQPEDEIAPKLEALGFSPDDVRWVIMTHLHTDHAGGLAHFQRSEILVHRSEFDNASGFMGKMRGFLPQRWPSWFSPRLSTSPGRPSGRSRSACG